MAAPNMLTIAEAADLTNVNPRTLRRYIADGRLRAFRFNSQVVRIAREDLQAFAGSNMLVSTGTGNCYVPVGEGGEVGGAMDVTGSESAECDVSRSLSGDMEPCQHPRVYASGPRAGLCTVCGLRDGSPAPAPKSPKVWPPKRQYRKRGTEPPPRTRKNFPLSEFCPGSGKGPTEVFDASNRGCCPECGGAFKLVNSGRELRVHYRIRGKQRVPAPVPSPPPVPVPVPAASNGACLEGGEHNFGISAHHRDLSVCSRCGLIKQCPSLC